MKPLPVGRARLALENHQCVVLAALTSLENEHVREDLSFVSDAAPETVLRIESSRASEREQLVTDRVVRDLVQVVRKSLQIYPDLIEKRLLLGSCRAEECGSRTGSCTLN